STPSDSWCTCLYAVPARMRRLDQVPHGPGGSGRVQCAGSYSHNAGRGCPVTVVPAVLRLLYGSIPCSGGTATGRPPLGFPVSGAHLVNVNAFTSNPGGRDHSNYWAVGPGAEIAGALRGHRRDANGDGRPGCLRAASSLASN